jgi:hypothetical protein
VRGGGGGDPISPISGQDVGPGFLSLRLPLWRRHEGGGTSFLRSGLVVRVSFCLLWCVVGVVGAASGEINLPQLHSHTGGDLHGGVSELLATCACRSFRSAAWSSRRSSDLARSVSQRVTGVCRCPRRCWGPWRGECSKLRMLVRGWWICRYSPTLSMGCGGS